MCRYLMCLTQELSQVYHKFIKGGHLLKPTSLSLSIDYQEQSNLNFNDDNYAYIYPCVQINHLGINQDVKFAKILYSFLAAIKDKYSEMIFCTSYFNVAAWLRNIMLNSEHKWKILTSGPMSNSFFNSKGLSGCIQEIYRYNLYSLVNESEKTSSNVQAFEYNCENQTFHAKGI